MTHSVAGNFNHDCLCRILWAVHDRHGKGFFSAAQMDFLEPCGQESKNIEIRLKFVLPNAVMEIIRLLGGSTYQKPPKSLD